MTTLDAPPALADNDAPADQPPTDWAYTPPLGVLDHRG